MATLGAPRPDVVALLVACDLRVTGFFPPSSFTPEQEERVLEATPDELFEAALLIHDLRETGR